MSINERNVIKNIASFVACLFVLLNSTKILAESSESIIDIYGTHQFTAADVKSRYGADFQELTTLLRNSNAALVGENSKRVSNLITKINRELHDMGDFAYIDTGPLLYTNDKNDYYTIDVVEKNDVERLNAFMANPNQSFPDPDGLIAAWKEYETAGLNKFIRNDADLSEYKCPFTHCTNGFDVPEFQKYKDIFGLGIIKNKDQMINILYKDRDPSKRAIAAFLLGNLTDNRDVIKFLTPAMYDPSPAVRNNVMRVLGAALENDKNAEFPIQEAVAALDFPSVTDRNKADHILLSLSIQPRFARYIKDHASHQLIAQLKMLQPNIHNGAYQILKNISGKNYGERDYASWQNWLDYKSL